MEVVLVSGPPCAGKSHHVLTHARPGDLVLDQDVMGAKAFEHGVRTMHTSGAPRAWVIRCLAGPARREHYRVEVGATDHVHLLPPTHVLIERARQRANPARHVAAVRSWLDQEAGRAHVPGPVDPSPMVRAWW